MSGRLAFLLREPLINLKNEIDILTTFKCLTLYEYSEIGRSPVTINFHQTELIVMSVFTSSWEITQNVPGSVTKQRGFPPNFGSSSISVLLTLLKLVPLTLSRISGKTY